MDDTTSILGRLLNTAEETYTTSSGRKFALKLDSIPTGDQTQQDAFNDLMNNQFKKFFKSSNSVLVLNRGMELSELSQKGGDTRDIRKLLDDAFEITAMAFGYPQALLTGRVENTKQATDQLLTFVIDPILQMIQTEINAKLYL